MVRAHQDAACGPEAAEGNARAYPDRGGGRGAHGAGVNAGLVARLAKID